jgi:DNA-binding response OmpR family regulator
MVSSTCLETDRVWGLRQGAVDNMVMPVDPKTLVR